MSSSFILSAYQSVREVDQDIVNLQTQIRRELKNAQFTAISRLPLEVISIIFEHLAFSAYADLQGFLQVTQACRTWRDVALNSPRIWGRIPADIPESQAKLLLERSKSAPLFLELTGSEPPYVDPATVQIVLEHARRLKEVDLVANKDTHGYLKCFLDGSTPLLTTLFIQCDTGSLDPQKYRFTQKVNEDIIPSLRVLGLMDCTFDLDSPKFSSLRKLKINVLLEDSNNHDSVPKDVLLSPTHLLTALQAMPQLITLLLRYCLAGSLSVQPDFAVHLPFLAYAHVSTENISDLCIFKHITAPKLRSLRLACRRSTDPDVLVSAIRPALELLPSPSESAWQTKLDIGISGNDPAAKLSAWITRQNPVVDLPSSVELDSKFFGSRNLGSELGLCGALPSGQPDVISFTWDDEILCGVLKEFCRQMEDVKELHVQDPEGAFLILEDTPSPPVKRDARFSLPSLKRIVIVDKFEYYLGYSRRDNPSPQRLKS